MINIVPRISKVMRPRECCGQRGIFKTAHRGSLAVELDLRQSLETLRADSHKAVRTKPRTRAQEGSLLPSLRLSSFGTNITDQWAQNHGLPALSPCSPGPQRKPLTDSGETAWQERREAHLQVLPCPYRRRGQAERGLGPGK